MSSIRHLYLGPNRTACEVLEELRKCNEVRNYSCLLGLVEELQIMFNKMEAVLQDVKDINAISKKRSEYKKEIRKLEERLEKLKEKVEKHENSGSRR